MRRLWTATALAVLLGGLAVGAWFYLHPLPVGALAAIYRVGSAPTFSLAKRELRAIDSGRERTVKLRELAAGWGLGNQPFDFYLAQYLGEPECSDQMREVFSLELGWRPELLPRWASYWAWRSKQEPAEEIESIADYLAALASLDPPQRLSWRETLNLQAAIALTGDAELARRLTPENWQKRYREWIAARAEWRNVRRPASPLPDWQGPLPR